MSKQAEKDYLKKLDAEAVENAFNKPFPDPRCGLYFAEVGAVLTLLPEPPGRLLDVGCGTGWTSWMFAKRGYEVTGVDIAEDMIRYARLNAERYDVPNARFVAMDYEATTFDNEFDCAVFYDSLHHAVDPESAVQMVYKALKPNGICITSEPGAGHSHRGRATAEQFGVTEQSMPPRKVISLGKKVGFRAFEIYPHAQQLHSALYRRPESVRRPIVRTVLGAPVIKNLVAHLVVGIYKSIDGIVVMRK
jgi:2-polyprenyl-3-methyl-5-hydroxy-6-metoxy-1,4-benzoquinol methylase